MNSQEDPNPDYLAYMLRMWRKRDANSKIVWCASLQEPGSQNSESFGDIEALFAVLRSRLGIESPGPTTTDTSGSLPLGPPD